MRSALASAAVASAHNAATPMATAGRRLMTYTPNRTAHRSGKDRAGEILPQQRWSKQAQSRPTTHPDAAGTSCFSVTCAFPSSAAPVQLRARANHDLALCLHNPCGEIWAAFCQLLQAIFMSGAYNVLTCRTQLSRAMSVLRRSPRYCRRPPDAFTRLDYRQRAGLPWELSRRP